MVDDDVCSMMRVVRATMHVVVVVFFSVLSCVSRVRMYVYSLSKEFLFKQISLVVAMATNAAPIAVPSTFTFVLVNSARVCKFRIRISCFCVVGGVIIIATMLDLDLCVAAPSAHDFIDYFVIHLSLSLMRWLIQNQLLAPDAFVIGSVIRARAQSHAYRHSACDHF